MSLYVFIILGVFTTFGSVTVTLHFNLTTFLPVFTEQVRVAEPFFSPVTLHDVFFFFESRITFFLFVFHVTFSFFPTRVSLIVFAFPLVTVTAFFDNLGFFVFAFRTAPGAAAVRQSPRMITCAVIFFNVLIDRTPPSSIYYNGGNGKMASKKWYFDIFC